MSCEGPLQTEAYANILTSGKYSGTPYEAMGSDRWIIRDARGGPILHAQFLLSGFEFQTSSLFPF